MVNLTTLKAFAKARGFNQSDLARAAGVSRQRVSQWFDSDASVVNIRSDHLHALATSLGVRVDELLNSLPLLGDGEAVSLETTELLWDQLYPDLVSFAIDAGRGRPRAVARLVQVYGLYATARMLGSEVWSKFPEYKKYLQPIRRKELELLWTHRQSRMER